MTYPDRFGQVENYMTRPVRESFTVEEPPYDPSLNAIECSTYQIEHGLTKFSWWWCVLSEAQRMEVGRELARCFDKWDNEER